MMRKMMPGMRRIQLLLRRGILLLRRRQILLLRRRQILLLRLTGIVMPSRGVEENWRRGGGGGGTISSRGHLAGAAFRRTFSGHLSGDDLGFLLLGRLESVLFLLAQNLLAQLFLFVQFLLVFNLFGRL